MKIKQETLDTISDALDKGASIDDIIRALGGEPSVYTEKDTCYRCWQVGRKGVPGICMVRYNADDPERAWTSASCASCLKTDMDTFPAGRVVVSGAMGEA